MGGSNSKQNALDGAIPSHLNQPQSQSHDEDEFHAPPKGSVRGSTRGYSSSSFSLFSCPNLFCPPGGDGGSPTLSSSRHSVRFGSKHGSTRGSGSSNEDIHVDFGTPIPDTPDPVRRIKQAAAAAAGSTGGNGSRAGSLRQQRREYYGDDDDDEEEEKKNSGGSFGRSGQSGMNGVDGFNGMKNGGARGMNGVNGVNGSLGGSDYLKMSNYSGLEKEASDMFSYEKSVRSMRGSSRQVGQQGRDTYAEIHDGKDAESKLYSKYEILEVLGVGSTSTCHRCIHLPTSESRACKIIDKTEIDPAYKNMMDQFYMEIQTLRSLQHPNIIQLYDVFITEDKIYIIMELMSGGELFDYVVQKGTLTEEEASRIVRKVTSALVYMHSKNVIHRDLKPENLLLAHKPRSSHDIEVKIIDFGLSKIMVDGPMANSFLGTRGYLAPEMIQRREYTKSVDAWALGVIVFVLLCGCLPFDDDCQSIPTSPELRTKFTLRFPRWAKDLSSSAKDLLNHLLDIDYRRRYTAEQAMDHPWVRGETASKDSLLQSPGRIKASPGGRVNKQGSSQATKEHVSQMVANRAIANAQRAGRSPKMHVRKTSI